MYVKWDDNVQQDLCSRVVWSGDLTVSKERNQLWFVDPPVISSAQLDDTFGQSFVILASLD